MSHTSFSGVRLWGIEENKFCMFIHLAQLIGYVFPAVGIALPIIMWATNRKRSVLADQHGKNVINWMISSFIYMIISVILVFVFIGIPLLIAIGICSLVFTIIGGIRANDGIVYKYPLSITFLS